MTAHPLRRRARAAEREAATAVFVYGTLLVGERNHHYLERSRRIAEARTQPAFTLYDLGAFPGLVGGGRHAVQGELYEVDEPTLAALDRLEAHPAFYRRTGIVLEAGATAQTYLLTSSQVAGRPMIASGHWRTRQKDA